MAAPLSADYLIVGSGIAGLRAAIALAPHGRVLMLTKADQAAGSTGYAQGGIAAAVGAGDSPSQHAKDTITAGDGLADDSAVRVLVTEGPKYVHELIEWGAPFDFDSVGNPSLAREGAHSVRRVLHSHDATGRAIARVLALRLRQAGDVTVVDHALVTGLLLDDNGRVGGARFLDRNGDMQVASAGATLLATGGAGQVYQHTTNPSVATGDGIAIAFLAGARVMDLEFVQFHPTVLDVPGAPNYLLSEALRGEGGKLVNEHGEPFMVRYEPDADLASRDRVARAVVLERERTGGRVFLTMADLPAETVRRRFPMITELCARVGLDLARDRIPVGPAAHYLMGGVATDLEGRSSLPGLFAAGEVACTGVHGANRLASNSLLEGLVFGARAGDAMRNARENEWPGPHTAVHRDHPPEGRPGSVSMSKEQIQALMTKSAGIFRERESLESAAAALDAAWTDVERDLGRGATFDADGWQLLNLVTVSRLIVRAALRREETRGAHARTDFPQKERIRNGNHSAIGRFLALVSRRGPAGGACRLLTGQGLHGDSSVRLRDLGVDPAVARSTVQSDRARERVLSALHSRDAAHEGKRAR